MLDAVVKRLARKANLPIINISAECLKAGLPDYGIEPETARDLFSRNGYIFSGFRCLKVPPDLLLGRKTVLLVRDPRDMFVSYYFSAKFGHSVPPEGTVKRNLLELRAVSHQLDINEFVLSEYTTPIVVTLRAYMNLLESSWKLYRYEDVVFNKSDWLQDIAAYLHIDLAKKTLCEIARSVDHFPSQENPNAHIRQVAPGNHRKHLSRSTIAKLTESLSDVLYRFGYLGLAICVSCNF